MFEILRKRSRCVGSALFRGNLPPRLEEFAHLPQRGIRVEPLKADESMHWRARLRHPEWGDAEAVCFRDVMYPSREVLGFDPKLSDDDVDAIYACDSSVSLQMEGRSRFVLRDRKFMLRFLDALLGAAGVAAADHASEMFWTRPALEDELSHDADLDVRSVYTIHAVREDDGEQIVWFHTHGLAELGAFDFDVLRPSESFLDHSGDFTRALAFAILDGHAKAGMTELEIAYPFYPLHLVPAERFMKRGRPADTALRDDPEGHHLRDRVVICDPPPQGLFGRLFGSERLKPQRGFMGEISDRIMVYFTHSATALMADRARKTYPVLRRIAEEMAEFELPVAVKLGYEIDVGEPDECEHLWFDVHALADDHVEATLVNQPRAIARMQQGERGNHPVERLSDWMMITPFGPISPHTFHARRLINANRDQVRQLVAEAKAAQED